MLKSLAASLTIVLAASVVSSAASADTVIIRHDHGFHRHFHPAFHHFHHHVTRKVVIIKH